MKAGHEASGSNTRIRTMKTMAFLTLQHLDAQRAIQERTLRPKGLVLQ